MMLLLHEAPAHNVLGQMRRLVTMVTNQCGCPTGRFDGLCSQERFTL